MGTYVTDVEKCKVAALMHATLFSFSYSIIYLFMYIYLFQYINIVNCIIIIIFVCTKYYPSIFT